MAEIALSREFLAAYAQLPRKAQRKLDELLTKFRQDSTAASIHLEPLQRATDPQLRSARIGDDYRVILRAPERGDVFIALWADHHDEAYRWASNRQTAIHPATGTLQIFDVSAASRVVTEVSGAASESQQSELDISLGAVPSLFDAFSDDALFTAGVPRALLPSVRAVTGDEDLERLAPHLPPEAGEILTGLAAGLSLDEAIEDVLGRLPVASGAPEPAPVDTTDIKSALEREGTQRQFLLLSDALDLDAALRHPLDAWRVFLHPKQRRIVRARTRGPMRVTGGAGTGKTVVALHRTAFLVREVYQKPDDRVLLTTFTVNLAHDLRSQLAKLLGPDDLARVEIANIDRWASEYLRRQGESFQQVFDEEQRKLMRQVHDVYGVDEFDVDFCLAEWREVISDQDLRNEEDYVKAVRRYRGVPLSRAQRRSIWPVFAEYRQLLEEGKRLEPLEVIRRARTKLEAAMQPARYQAVVVDETQDFSAEALRLVRTIAGPEHPDDLFLVGDAHQRIYGRSTPLSNCGISVRGRRSQTLRINYRTTASISRFAFGALHGVEVDDLDDGKADRRGAVALRDGPEPIVTSLGSAHDEELAVVGAVQQALQRGVAPEAIAVLARTKALLEERFGPALQDAGIDWVLLEQDEPRRTAVRLATLHRAKGLEFPIVILAGASADILPYPSQELKSKDPIVSAQALLRERCLLYVGTSRARDELYVFSHGTPSALLEVMPRARSFSERPQEVRISARSEEPAAEAAPVGTGDTNSASPSALAKRLDALFFPARIVNFADGRDLSTVDDLAKIAPSDLLAERKIGRGSIAASRAILEPLLGMTWERYASEASGVEPQGEASDAKMSLVDAGAAGNWDQVRFALSQEQLETALSEIDFSARGRGYVEREGLRSLRELTERSRADLVSAPNLGRGTVREIAAVVARHFDRLSEDVVHYEIGLLDGFRTLLQELDQMERIIVSRRSGLSGTESTLEEIGELFGVTRERIRQIEVRACEQLALHVGWATPCRAKIGVAMANGAVPLDSLELDPWWAGVVALPSVLEFIARTILGLEFRVILWSERAWLSPVPKQPVDRINSDLRARLESTPLPAPLVDIVRMAEEVAQPLGDALAKVIVEEALGTLHVEDCADGSKRVLGIGETRRAEALAFLRASPTPVHIETLYRALGVRVGLPEEVIHFGRGIVGLRQHFQDYDSLKARLGPACAALMRRLGPERQWATAELVEELREEYDLPLEANPYWLSALLRDFEAVRYLGRNRVTLPESDGSTSRIFIHEALQKLLVDAGAPVPRNTLLERLEATLGATDIALAQVFTRPQFVRLGEDRVGLRQRDVPGGESAIQEATDLVAAVLGRREVGLSAWQAHQEVRTLSPAHESWHRDLTMSLLRNDERFRLNQSGSVGLAVWETTRVPTRLEIVRAALAAAGGAVTVEALEARIAAHYGEPPLRGTIASMANQLGAALDGDWVRVRVGI